MYSFATVTLYGLVLIYAPWNFYMYFIVDFILVSLQNDISFYELLLSRHSFLYTLFVLRFGCSFFKSLRVTAFTNERFDAVFRRRVITVSVTVNEKHRKVRPLQAIEPRNVVSLYEDWPRSTCPSVVCSSHAWFIIRHQPCDAPSHHLRDCWTGLARR